jgi:hypothetical protein
MLNLATARGAKPLEAFGYASPCEFRACSRPQRISTKFGNYCSERHARLIGNNERRSGEWIVNTDPYNVEHDAEQNEDKLSRIALDAKVIA